jgi:hypothetical protein
MDFIRKIDDDLAINFLCLWSSKVGKSLSYFHSCHLDDEVLTFISDMRLDQIPPVVSICG